MVGHFLGETGHLRASTIDKSLLGPPATWPKTLRASGRRKVRLFAAFSSQSGPHSILAGDESHPTLRIRRLQEFLSHTPGGGPFFARIHLPVKQSRG